MNHCTALQFLGISHRFSQHNLHIRCGLFGVPQACSVMNLLLLYRDHCNHIFIDVREAAQPQPLAAQGFKAACRQTRLSPRQIIFKGQGGFALAVDGNRVIVLEMDSAGKKPGCCGKCASCPRCGQKREAAALAQSAALASQPVSALPAL